MNTWLDFDLCWSKMSLLLSMMEPALCVMCPHVAKLCVGRGFLRVCGHVSMRKVEPKKLLLRRRSPAPLCHLSPHYLHLESVLLRNVRGKERSLCLVNRTDLVQNGLIRTRAGVREDAGLSSGYVGERGKNGLCLKRYLHLKASLRKRTRKWQDGGEKEGWGRSNK